MRSWLQSCKMFLSTILIMKMDFFFFLKSLIVSSGLDCTLSLLPHDDTTLTVPFVTQVQESNMLSTLVFMLVFNSLSMLVSLV